MPVDPGQGPKVRVLWHVPANEAHDVPTAQSIRVQFDRFLAPDSVTRQTICVTPESVGAGVQPGRCLGGMSPEYDPVDRVAVWLYGYLSPDTRYNVRIARPVDEHDATGIRAFDGAPMAEDFTFAFRTAAGPHAQPGVPNRDISLCDPEAAAVCPLPDGACVDPRPGSLVASAPAGLLSGCAGASANCHAPQAPAGPGPRGSALALSAEGIARIVETARIAAATATAADPSIVHRGPLDQFGQNMPYVDRNRPASSYLLYKLILADPVNCVGEADLDDDPIVCAEAQTITAGDAAAPGPIGPWISDDDWRPPATGERTRLRTRIRGLGMPPGTRVSHRWVQTVSAWIASGAKVDGCP
jgi:hypothetical protein